MRKKRRRPVVVVFSNFLFVPSRRGEGERGAGSLKMVGEEGYEGALVVLGHIIEEAEDEGGGGGRRRRRRRRGNLPWTADGLC